MPGGSRHALDICVVGILLRVSDNIGRRRREGFLHLLEFLALLRQEGRLFTRRRGLKLFPQAFCGLDPLPQVLAARFEAAPGLGRRIQQVLSLGRRGRIWASTGNGHSCAAALSLRHRIGVAPRALSALQSAHALLTAPLRVSLLFCRRLARLALALARLARVVTALELRPSLLPRCLQLAGGLVHLFLERVALGQPRLLPGNEISELAGPCSHVRGLPLLLPLLGR